MRTIERQNAIELRKTGLTYDEIKQRLGLSKSTLSVWLRNVPYSVSKISYARRRLASFRNSQILHNRKVQRISQIISEAKKELRGIDSYELKLLGAMAYWTEGSKTQDSLVKFTNSNPEMIKFILRWLREACFVPEEKLKFHLRIHGDLNKTEIEEYWSKLTRIPLSRFYKTTFKISGTNGGRHNKLKYGIATVIVCNTDLFYKIQGWIEGIADNLSLKN